MPENEIYAIVLNAVGNYGFPIAVTIYLLIRFEKKLELLTHSIQELTILLKEGMKH